MKVGLKQAASVRVQIELLTNYDSLPFSEGANFN